MDRPPVEERPDASSLERIKAHIRHMLAKLECDGSSASPVAEADLESRLATSVDGD